MAPTLHTKLNDEVSCVYDVASHLVIPTYLLIHSLLFKFQSNHLLLPTITPITLVIWNTSRLGLLSWAMALDRKLSVIEDT